MLAGGLLPVDPTGGAPTAQVAAIQGNVPRARNLPQLLNDSKVTQNHVEATLRLAAEVKAGRRPAPSLVVWPENSTDLDPFARTLPSTPSSPRRRPPSASRSWSGRC